MRYGSGYAFLGFFIADEEYRGRGIGLDLWKWAIARAEGRTIGLDGVVGQQENYRKSGFGWSHANIRYGGVVNVTEPPGTELVDVAPVHAASLIDYDMRFNPTRREAFLREWTKQLQTRRSVVLLRDGAMPVTERSASAAKATRSVRCSPTARPVPISCFASSQPAPAGNGPIWMSPSRMRRHGHFARATT